MLIRKFSGFILTTLLTGLLLNFFFAITGSYDELVSALGILLTRTAPFILLIGLPVSIIAVYLTKNLYGKQRYIKALLIHQRRFKLLGAHRPLQGKRATIAQLNQS